MSNHYDNMAFSLQSRISKRANKITENVMWKIGYRHLGRMNDWRECKNLLAKLDSDQKLDKKLLKLARAAAREFNFLSCDN